LKDFQKEIPRGEDGIPEIFRKKDFKKKKTQPGSKKKEGKKQSLPAKSVKNLAPWGKKKSWVGELC